MSGPIVLAAGGTGGHLFPAQALAAELAARGHGLALVTDRRGAAFGAALGGGVAVHQVPAGAVSGRGILGRMRGLAEVAWGVLRARRLLRRIDPAVVVGFGGYASVPAVLAAAQLGLPTVIHEQNAVLGRANRLLAGRVGAIALAHAETARIKAADAVKVRHTGNPVRAAVAALADTPYPTPETGGTLSILVTGGSQGAAVMTQVVPGALSSLPGPPRHLLRVVQQCRAEDLDAARATYRAAGIEAELAAFFDDMPVRLAAAQLVIARAGASTVAELTAAGRPAILVPLPAAIDDHQSANARAVERAGGGWLMPQPDFTPQALAARVAEFLADPAPLAAAAARARAAGTPGAAARLADLVESSLVGANHSQPAAARGRGVSMWEIAA